MKKIIKILTLITLILIVCLFLFKNLVVNFAVSKGVKAFTGLKLSIKDMNVGIKETIIGIEEMKLYNPPNFKDRLMVEMPEIYINYDLPAILKGTIYFKEIRINLKEFVVIKNEDGELNLNSLKVIKESQKKEKLAVKKETPDKNNVQIDMLKLKIERVIYKDYSKGGEPEIEEYKVNIDEEYENITDFKSLARLIVVKALIKTNIAKLIDFDLRAIEDLTTGVLNKTIGGLGRGAKEVVEGVAGKTTDIIKNIFQSQK
ncbi:MAG: hypothetical protein P9M06_00345 [Candidatus Saelkia tenebricola]|nr:hypothetical protein [Candidatus Saelkia tenebricola]